MLSYQHAYHAGNLADLHKHALLATALDYLTRKPKPLTYIETHAGRGLYHLASPEARKTGEAARGIEAHEDWLPPPLARALALTRAAHGQDAYPGSPLIAAHLLRDTDTLHLAELHPQEHAALTETLGTRATIHKTDGLDLALALTPPTPRRGLLLADPSYEVKTDYDRLPDTFAKLARKWIVGTLMLWYPILKDGPHRAMVRKLEARHPDHLTHEVRFPPVREGHRMEGSGLFLVNPPYGIADEAKRLSALFATLA